MVNIEKQLNEGHFHGMYMEIGSLFAKTKELYPKSHPNFWAAKMFQYGYAYGADHEKKKQKKKVKARKK